MPKVVYLDPGHGGISTKGGDPGAIGPAGTHEAVVNLAVAELVKDKLEAHGVAVGLTRSDESNPSLYKRYTVANTMRADLFVSIHCNSAASDKATGTEVWIRRDDASDSERQIAALLSSGVSAALGIVNRGVKQVSGVEQDYAMLRGSRCPAAIIELGFIRNPAEEALLASSDGQQRAAEAICAAVLEWLGVAPVVPDVRVMIDGRMTDIPTRLIDDQTWVPLRRIAEELGCRVDWDGETRIVKLLSKENG